MYLGSKKTTAIVFGGGGVSGIAWLIGVLAGLVRSGLTVQADCKLIGTSAGSVVGAQFAHGLSPEFLLTRQLSSCVSEKEPFRQYSQHAADAKNQVLVHKVAGDLDAARKRIGAFARRSETPDLEQRRLQIESRLAHHDWPSRPLSLTAVNTITGQRVVLDKQSGLKLVEAVMASCAVPGVWPPVPFAETELMDGGIWSMTNADLGDGYDHILILAPLGYSINNPVSGHLNAEIDSLRRSGSEVQIIVPDEIAKGQIGDNVLDPDRISGSATAGLAQGLLEGKSLNAVWF